MAGKTTQPDQIADRHLRNGLRMLMILRGVVGLTLLITLYINSVSPEQGILKLIFFLCAYTLVFALFFKRVKDLTLYAVIQIILDIGVISGVVLQTGGVESVYSFLYVLAIISACILLTPQAGYFFAALCTISFGSLIALQVNGQIRVMTVWGVSQIQDLPGNYALYTMMAHTLAFFSSAYLSNFLSDQFWQTRLEMEKQREQIEELESFQKDILVSIASGLITTDSEGWITYVNHAGKTILGREEQDILHQKIAWLFGDEIQQKVRSLDGTRLGSPAILSEWLNRPDGGQAFVELSLSQFRNVEGNVKGFLIIFQDLTPLKELELRVRRQEQLAAIGEMAAGIAHEIRNPLGAIRGAVEMLDETAELEGTKKRLLSLILRESKRLNNLVEDVLDLARPPSLHLQLTNVIQLLEDIRTLITERFRQEGRPVVIKKQYHAENHLLLVDGEKLKQVFWNLIMNGCDAMPEGGTLMVTTYPASHIVEGTGYDNPLFLLMPPGERYLAIAISDTGIGIDDDTMNKLFTPFFSKKRGGLGLGLALANQIVLEHSGAIKAFRNRGPGVTFIVYLPLNRENGQEEGEV